MDEQYVVCLDTMGQDREFTDDEKRFAIQTVMDFKRTWDRIEVDCLRKDRNKKIELLEVEKEFFDSETAARFEEEEKAVERYLASFSSQQLDDELKEIVNKAARLYFVADLFDTNNNWKKNLMTLKEFKVLKYPRVMQSLLYLLGFNREEICERHTNRFFWKIAKNCINEDFPSKMCAFKVFGETAYPCFGY